MIVCSRHCVCRNSFIIDHLLK